MRAESAKSQRMPSHSSVCKSTGGPSVWLFFKIPSLQDPGHTPGTSSIPLCPYLYPNTESLQNTSKPETGSQEDGGLN